MTDDDGSAALEFIAVGVILLVPLVYLIIALGGCPGADAGCRGRRTAHGTGDRPRA
jgi:hypothetical protein